MAHCACIICTNHVVYVEHLLFFFPLLGVWNFDICYAEGVGTCIQVPPVKCGALSLKWTSLVTTFHICYNLIKHILCDSTEKGLLGLVTRFLQNYPPGAFPLCWFCFLPLTVINHRCEYGYMLCPVSPLVNYGTWRWSWEALKQRAREILPTLGCLNKLLFYEVPFN